tara:strand:+ start:1990 stop:3477 length:1488 start_codon:yes stop_codon:yes gene_type:complete
MIKALLKKNKLINEIYFRYNNAEKIFSREKLSYINSDQNEVFENNLFFKKNTKINYKNLKINEDINSVAGWIPYIKNKTNVVIYNFFSTNYSLRNILLVRFSVIHDLELKFQTCFWIPINCVHEIDSMEICKNVDGNSAVIEFFHPNIKKNHAGHDGHLRFWGKYYSAKSNYISTVHSMPFAKRQSYGIKTTKSRSYNLDLENQKSYVYSISNANMFDKFYTNSKQLAGFNVNFNKNNEPSSVFHLSPFISSEFKKLNTNSKTAIQSFWIPRSKNIDPIIVVDNYEIGVMGDNYLTFYLIKGRDIIEEKSFTINDFFSQKISEIFDNFENGPYTIMCKFKYNLYGYIHVHYNSKLDIGDQVHAHLSNWDCGSTLKANEISSRGSARKFLHVSSNHDNNYNYYLMIHAHKVKNISKPKVKVRAFSDSGREFINNYDLAVEEPIKIFDLKKEFGVFFNDIDKIGVIQMESYDDNFDGSLMYHDLDNDFISVDHLTGG